MLNFAPKHAPLSTYAPIYGGLPNTARINKTRTYSASRKNEAEARQKRCNFTSVIGCYRVFHRQ